MKNLSNPDIPDTPDLPTPGLKVLMTQSVAKGHPPGHMCKVCQRTRNRILAGRPSNKAKKEAADARRQAKLQAKQKELEDKKLSRAREEGKLEGILAGQLAAGKAPDIALTAKLTGASPNRIQEKIGSDFVQMALSSAGISDKFLAELAKEGMGAFLQRIITDRDGNIIDVVNMPDWKARHNFWRDVLLAKKILGQDSESNALGSGGLIVITPDNAKVLPGHPPACVCEKCVLAWEEKTSYLRRNAIKENAILASAVNSQQSAIEDAEEIQDVVEEDDFGPLE